MIRADSVGGIAKPDMNVTFVNQPDRSLIYMDNECALMARSTFERLDEYSCSVPTGQVIGKMWRRHDGAFDRAFTITGGTPVWLLYWYARDENGNTMIHTRKIVIALAPLNFDLGENDVCRQQSTSE